MSDLIVRDLAVQLGRGETAARPLDGVTFEVASGSLAILLGPSGCGKTTLLSCLAGILRPGSGSIRFDGREVTALAGASLLEYRRRSVGIVFQAFNLVPSLSALENVAAPLLAAGVPTRRARARAEELLHSVELGDRCSHRPGALSGGQQQRVAIARALVHEPPLILADEPTAHLDHVQVEEILRLVRGLAAPGRVVVVATHDDRILPLADQVIDLLPPAEAAPAGPQLLELGPGGTVFREGERGALVYLVEEGQVEIVRSGAGGAEERVAVIETGDYFGEMGPLFQLPRSATARALGPAVVSGRSVEEFRALLGVEHLRDLVKGRARARVRASAAQRHRNRLPR